MITKTETETLTTVPLKEALEILQKATAVEVTFDSFDYVRYHRITPITGDPKNTVLNIVTPNPEDEDHVESNLVLNFNEGDNQEVTIHNGALLFYPEPEDSEEENAISGVAIVLSSILQGSKDEDEEENQEGGDDEEEDSPHPVSVWITPLIPLKI